ncbi:MAG: STAS domain-containing protein [Nitrospirales bacterium]|nr:STAS domain-containing protein [Nitrospira sp.]MDR4502315.1 STAS domain-containing protein [Nitrospirales bacterium]
MQISEQTGEEGIVVLDLEGRFDFSSRKAFKDTVERIQKEGCSHIIINMDRVSFVDSSALGLLVIASQNLKCKHAQLSIVNPQPYVRQVLDLANVPKMVPVYSSLNEAKQQSPSPATATS